MNQGLIIILMWVGAFAYSSVAVIAPDNCNWFYFTIVGFWWVAAIVCTSVYSLDKIRGRY